MDDTNGDDRVFACSSSNKKIYNCALCGKSQPRKELKRRCIPSNFWIECPRSVSRYLCGGGKKCYTKVLDKISAGYNYVFIEDGILNWTMR